MHVKTKDNLKLGGLVVWTIVVIGLSIILAVSAPPPHFIAELEEARPVECPDYSGNGDNWVSWSKPGVECYLFEGLMVTEVQVELRLAAHLAEYKSAGYGIGRDQSDPDSPRFLLGFFYSTWDDPMLTVSLRREPGGVYVAVSVCCGEDD